MMTIMRFYWVLFLGVAACGSVFANQKEEPLKTAESVTPLKEREVLNP